MKKKIILVIPVYNEEFVLENSVKTLYEYMNKNIEENWKIIIADNASTDDTEKIIEKLTKEVPHVEGAYLSCKGRGNALKYVWNNYKADVYSYCDVDLATDISHLKKLFNNILEGYDIVIASRYIDTSISKRTLDRLILSKGYIYLIKLFFKTKFSDFQCGFKAINNKIVEEILPEVRNKEWFFDTELLLLTEQSMKYKIKQIPIIWHENRDTKVKVLKTTYDFIKNLINLKIRLLKNKNIQIK